MQSLIENAIIDLNVQKMRNIRSIAKSGYRGNRRRNGGVAHEEAKEPGGNPLDTSKIGCYRCHKSGCYARDCTDPANGAGKYISNDSRCIVDF